MQDILDQLRSWVEEGHAVALATVVNTWGSSPRAVGAHMAVCEDGTMAGSVSGGCVEGAVVEEALAVLSEGAPKLLQYGVADETAWGVGLACGGSIEIFVQVFDPNLLGVIEEGYRERDLRAQITVLAGPESLIGRVAIFNHAGKLAGEWPADQPSIDDQLMAILAGGAAKRVQLDAEGEPIDVIVEVFLPAATLIMIGGVHISIALSKLARPLGYRTVVIDPRKSFAAADRFADADEIINLWPEEGLSEVGIDANTAIAVLTHDPKIDDPALLVALRSPAFYVGALGSRATHAKRVDRLREEGLNSSALGRLKAPIGMDLGGRTPEEIALSILAEIVAARHGKLRKET